MHDTNTILLLVTKVADHLRDVDGQAVVLPGHGRPARRGESKALGFWVERLPPRDGLILRLEEVYSTPTETVESIEAPSVPTKTMELDTLKN